MTTVLLQLVALLIAVAAILVPILCKLGPIAYELGAANERLEQIEERLGTNGGVPERCGVHQVELRELKRRVDGIESPS